MYKRYVDCKHNLSKFINTRTKLITLLLCTDLGRFWSVEIEMGCILPEVTFRHQREGYYDKTCEGLRICNVIESAVHITYFSWLPRNIHAENSYVFAHTHTSIISCYPYTPIISCYPVYPIILLYPHTLGSFFTNTMQMVRNIAVTSNPCD